MREPKRTGKKNFLKELKIKLRDPGSHFLVYLEDGSPISIMFPNSALSGQLYPWPADSYIEEGRHDYPHRLIDAINGENKLVLTIDLNFPRTPTVEQFKKLLTVASEALEKEGRPRLKISGRDFQYYLKAYRLAKAHPEWTDKKLGAKMFPEEVDEDSRTRKARRFRQKAEELLRED